jgi:DNA primase
MSKISDRDLDEIQQRCDITEIISGYLPLKKAGRNFKANCPFHHEKTPSFIVSPDKQIFHCFGCGAGGDVFSFIMKQERMDFPEAVRFLAEKTGVKIQDLKKDEYYKKSYHASLYEVNLLAEKYFHQKLLQKNATSTNAFKYLFDRGLTKETINEFKIGLADDQWDGLKSFLLKNNIGNELILRSGLIIKNSQGKQYDRFRNRIIFPISNVQGKRIGFGGRIWQKDQNLSANQAKYINSPENEVYKKNKTLFGFNLAKNFIIQKDYCIVVEGYLDVIVPYQAGIKNLVASCGTAFTAEQARLLKRYTSNVVIIFDSDEAGQEAVLRSLDILLDEGLNVRIVALESGYDPDSYVRKYGAEAFKKLVDDAKSLFDYKLGLLSEKLDRNIPEHKAKIAQNMLQTIKRMQDPILRSTYIRQLSESLHVHEEILLKELNKIKTLSSFTAINPAADNVKIYKMSKAAEKMLMSLMFEDGGLIKELKEIVDYEEFSDPIAKKIVKHLYEQQKADIKPMDLFKKVEDRQINAFICNLLVSDLGIENKRKSFEDCVRRIKKDKIQLQLDNLQQQIQQTRQSDCEKLMVLLKKFDELKKEQSAYEKSK